ncbi:putative membrane protein [Mycobacterium xenopi 4042]|uniref:Putative membrane protein n=1 Tax=Mycobacterium xenopi 4042 TaxID=1299334 RepID=X8DWY1_MYCXE|nr:putative membrane protein [Mycobacterium xenopi 4042]
MMRRETNSWRWPALAFGYMFALAWVMAFAARSIAVGVGA